MKSKRTIRPGIAALVLAASLFVVALAACGKSPAEGAAASASARNAGAQGQNGGTGRRQATVPVQAIPVQVGLLSADRDTAGVVAPVTQSQVAAQVAGVVAKVQRLTGDWVRTGDPIVQLDDSQARLSLATAQAGLDNAKINLAVGEDNANQANPKLSLQVQSAQSALDSAQKFYDSQKALYALGGISASQLDSASSQLSAAQANLEGAKTALDQNQKSGDQTIAQLKLAVTQAENSLQQARLNLQYASIKAPFSGQLAAINVQPGMYVGLNTSVFSLVSSAREISFSVSPPDAPALPLGTKLTFEYGGKSYPIRVSQTPSAPISGVVPMVALATGPFNLPFGTVGNVSYLVGVAQGALVPIAALATLENQNFVFLVENGKAVVQDVSIIGEAGVTAVVNGIVAGSIVIVSPPPGLLQGTPVQVVAVNGQAAAGAPPQAGQPGVSGGAPAPGGAQGKPGSGSRRGQSSAAGAAPGAAAGAAPGAAGTTPTSATAGKP